MGATKTIYLDPREELPMAVVAMLIASSNNTPHI
jgi:hypothetical protein